MDAADAGAVPHVHLAARSELTEPVAGDGNSIGRTVTRLGLIIAGMFAMAFALVPVYDYFGDATGVNGKAPDTGYQVGSGTVDTSRTVDVQIVTTNSARMVWEVDPGAGLMQVHPGELRQAGFGVRNPASHDIVGHAVASVQPARAAAHVHKMRCFCAADERLAGGGAKQLRFEFVIDRQLPVDVHTITLAWTLFDVTDRVTAAM